MNETTTTTNHAAPHHTVTEPSALSRAGINIWCWWWGGALCVNAAVWSTLGLRYVPLFLMAFYFVFMLIYRKQISKEFPTQGGIYYFFHNREPMHSKTRLRTIMRITWLCMRFVIDIACIVYIFMSGSSLVVAVWLVGFKTNYNLFRLKNNRFYQQYPALFVRYNGDRSLCIDSNKILPGRLIKHYIRFFRFIRPTATILTIVALLTGCLYLYAAGIVVTEGRYLGMADPFGFGPLIDISLLTFSLLFPLITSALLSMEKTP